MANKTLVLIALSAILFLSSCSVDQKSPDLRSFVFEWSDGSCESDADCQPVEYGCGGGRIMCTNDPAKWKDVITTCEIIEDHPSKEGYSCACSAQEKRCGWAR